MLKALIKLAGIAALLGVAVFWFLTAPNPLPANMLTGIENGDVQNGELVFFAGGCASCHAKLGAKGDEKLLLGGRHPLNTPFGTFYAPNITPHLENGIGSWTGAQFANAMMRGIAPDGSHYYPAFPYTSYARMEIEDIADLWAYMKTLKPVDLSNLEHELPLPFRLRRGLGLWKTLFLHNDPIVEIDENDPQLARGRYLVEGPAHCGACHTPRNLIGGMDKSKWLAGGPAPEGKGSIPNITPHKTGLGPWTLSDIAYSLESGFTPEYDSFGSSMVSVQENMAKLPASDREAIAAYLKVVAAVPTVKP
ncbi:MAG: cytochrome c [Rhizobiaceae bacterium]|nr:cytochrome c [Rhizobiaceae bacterium]